ncbi:MAG TPA: gluconate 5-dehydrogenase, partial [Enterococcus sp.]|nr:gluconate 5-dehydrogenase [Enterococcus sp.]
MDFSMNDFRLDGKIALITGAVYGIGFTLAQALAKAGATIVFNNLDQASVDQGLANYKEAGIEAHGYVCDVTDEAAVQAMIKQIEAQ